MRRRLALFLLGSLLALPTLARADKPQRTWNYLTTGNGHGFQFFDTNQNKITHFLEHPYRYLRPRTDPRSDGYGRRNLAYDFYFGVRGGAGSGWLNEGTAGEASYVEESNVIKVPITQAGVSAETYYFAPFGYEGNALVALMKAPGATDGFALFNFHLGDGSPDSPSANGESLRASGDALVETGPGGGAMIYVPLTALSHADCVGVFNKVKGGQALGDNKGCRGDDIVPAFQATPGAGGWIGVAVLFVEDAAQADAQLAAFKAWVNSRDPQKLLDDALAEWRSWRKPVPAAVELCTEDEKRLWRQSEAVLRMGQVREPYTATRKNNGMMLASLPPGEWHTGWVRDAMYAIAALARLGHTDEAKLALEFFLNAEPAGKFSSYVSGYRDYRISVCRYFGNGEEEADYSGQQTPNVETDGWGLMLWATRLYLESSGDVAWLSQKTRLGPTVYEALRRGVAEAMAANTESSGIAKADSSIWEVHDENKKHFAYTTLTFIRGFCDMAAMAQKAGQGSDVTRYRGLSQKARDGFFASFQDQQGALAGSIEELAMNQYLDGAVVEAFTLNVLKDSDYQGRNAVATLEALGKLRVESGGFKRNDDGKSSYDNNEWILIDLRMSDALWRAGKEAEGLALQRMVTEKASANYNLLPELYNAVRADGAVGKYAGSIPMVGYGGGAFVLTMLDRAGLIEANDCGDGMGNKSSGKPLMCSSMPMTPGNMNNPQAPTADELPYENACLCDLRRGGDHGRGGGAVRFGVVAGVLAALMLASRRRRRAR